MVARSGKLSERLSILSRIRFLSDLGIFLSAFAADLLNSILYFKCQVPLEAFPMKCFHPAHFELSKHLQYPFALQFPAEALNPPLKQ